VITELLLFAGASSYVPGSTPMDTASGSSFTDPFTGAGRYVPPGGDLSRDTSVPLQGADPFTGLL